MPNIPSGTKFMGVDPAVDTAEKRSTLSNSYQEYYTIDDIIADAVANDTNIYNTDGTLTGNRIVTCDGNILQIDNGDGVNDYSQIYLTSSTSESYAWNDSNNSQGSLILNSDGSLQLDGVNGSNQATMSVATDATLTLYSSSGTSSNAIEITPTNITGIPVNIQLACSDETTALTTGTAKVTFRAPHAINLTNVRASLSTAQASGNIFTIDINQNGSSILSTKLTIDNTEKTSTTAATPAVFNINSYLYDDAEITIDIDQIGDGTAKGLKVTLIGTRA